MKIAIIGSRTIKINFDIIKKYLPENITCIISGGAKGVDSVASAYAKNNNIKLIEFLPNYKKYGRKAPLVRNTEIIKNSDFVLAFWDNKSRGTLDSINKAKKMNKPYKIVSIPTTNKS